MTLELLSSSGLVYDTGLLGGKAISEEPAHYQFSCPHCSTHRAPLGEKAPVRRAECAGPPS